MYYTEEWEENIRVRLQSSYDTTPYLNLLTHQIKNLVMLKRRTSLFKYLYGPFAPIT